MSIRSDAFLGYSVDILDKVKTLEPNLKDALLYAEFDKITPEEENKLKELNFVSYWDRINASLITDKIMIIDDGMSGEYTKLIYVIKYAPEVDIYDNAALSFIESINTYLNDLEVPDNIEGALGKLYKFIFKKELDTSNIQLESFIHYS